MQTWLIGSKELQVALVSSSPRITHSGENRYSMAKLQERVIQAVAQWKGIPVEQNQNQYGVDLWMPDIEGNRTAVEVKVIPGTNCYDDTLLLGNREHLHNSAQEAQHYGACLEYLIIRPDLNSVYSIRFDRRVVAAIAQGKLSKAMIYRELGHPDNHISYHTEADSSGHVWFNLRHEKASQYCRAWHCPQPQPIVIG